MKVKTLNDLEEEIYGKILDGTYQEIADEIFNLAKEKQIDLYEAFRQVMWHKGRDVIQRVGKKCRKTRRIEREFLSKKDARYFIQDEDDVRKIHDDIMNQLEDLFDEIVKKEYSEELEKKILKDQLEFYERWKQNSEEDVKKYQKDKDEFMVKKMERFVQGLEKDCESIRKGIKIGNKQFASAFMSKKEDELWHRRLDINPQE